jgi:hypothetical protein
MQSSSIFPSLAWIGLRFEVAFSQPCVDIAGTNGMNPYPFSPVIDGNAFGER